MILGTVRLEEARVFDSQAGDHTLADDEGNQVEIMVFWAENGWQWQVLRPVTVCMSGAGPFASSSAALQDARDWWGDPDSEEINNCL